MKVIVDNKIPYIREVIEQLADEVVYLPGKAFTPEVVKDADALIIRTRTICNRELLEGSNVRFIGTATIGFDHIDTVYCQQAGITWSNCPGCNAGAVEQYLHAVLLLLQKEKGLNLQESCLGIIGVGHVGERIRQMAQRLGLKVLPNDPPRADQGEEGFCSLDTLAEQCNILTFHTPLIREGKYKSYHLANSTFFQKLQQSPYLINTSRGEVVDTEALLTAMNQGLVTSAVIDVWEHEPDIDLELLEKVIIGTPHIAGYSADGKANATRMSLEALCRFFRIETDYRITPPEPKNKLISTATYEEASLMIYDPRRDSDALKSHPGLFEQLRGDYPLRREEGAYRIVITK